MTRRGFLLGLLAAAVPWGRLGRVLGLGRARGGFVRDLPPPSGWTCYFPRARLLDPAGVAPPLVGQVRIGEHVLEVTAVEVRLNDQLLEPWHPGDVVFRQMLGPAHRGRALDSV